jgi:hypothetical protein
MAEMMKGPNWLMSRGDKEKAQGVYLTLETVNFEQKSLRTANNHDGEMVGSKYPRILRSEAHERRSNTSISENPGNRLKGNTKWK